MEFFIFILLVLIIFFVNKLNTTIKKFIKSQSKKDQYIYNSLENIHQKLTDSSVVLAKKVDLKEDSPEKVVSPIIPAEPIQAQIQKQPIKKESEIVEEKKEEVPIVEGASIKKDKSGKWPVLQQNTSTPKVATPTKRKPIKRESFFEKYPDIEKFIGENLINKIGIVILVLGIAFLVKYAIDKNWINEIGRVAIGVLSAGILIGVAHKLRKNYIAFSSVLIGGGLAVLYFTVSLAYHTPGYPLYGLQTATFAILSLITLFAVVLSILYDRMEIAILALLGGFASPLMVASGSGNYIVLFSYLTILNIGMLVLSYYKKWRAINIIAFICTMLFFGSWLSAEVYESDFSSFNGAVFFATGFYIIFFLMNIVYNLKYSVSFKVGDISLLLSNTFIYFSFMMVMLSHIDDGAYKGIYSILLAVFNFGFAYYINATKKSDSNLLYLLIGLVFTFVTLAIPLQLDGNYITLFWAIEAVLLLWLGQRSGFDIMKLGSTIVSFLMLISWLMDISSGYSFIEYEDGFENKRLIFIFNKLFITSTVVVASLLASLHLLKKENAVFAWFIPTMEYRKAIFIVALFVAYLAGLSEVNYSAQYYFAAHSSRTIAVLLYNAVFISMLLFLANKLKNKYFSYGVAGISAVFIVFFLSALASVYYYNLFAYIEDNNNVSFMVFVFRWLSYIIVLIDSVLLFGLIKSLNRDNSLQVYRINFSFFILTILVLLSTAMDSIALISTQNYDVLQSTQKIGYTILWGIISFLLMIIGMRRKIKFVRIISLVLFGVTIIKLFAYDIKNISEGGKIVAFILLGVLLLIISFMYQKVKRLIIDDETSPKEEDLNKPI